MPRPPVLYIRSPQAWAAIVAPVRLAMIETLRFLGPCSVAELASQLGRPADTLYRHLRILTDTGVVVHAGFRKAGRRTEELFDLAADDVLIGFRGRERQAEREVLTRTAGVILRDAERTFAAAAQAGDLDLSEKDRNAVIVHDLTWLTEEQFREARRHLAEYRRLLDQGRRNREGRLYTSVCMLAPCPARPTRRTRGASTSTRGRNNRPRPRSSG